MRFVRFLAVVATLFAASVSAAMAQDYALGPGDVISINVYDFPDLTMEARLSATGTVSYPLIGRIKLSGGTTTAAEDQISKKLKGGGFLTNPNVRVEVVEYGSKVVSVLGEVGLPGKYPLQRTSSVIDVIALAGGITELGGTEVILLRKSKGAAKQPPQRFDLRQAYGSGDLTGNYEVVDGDVIVVPRAPVVYVYGAVNAPGAYRLEPQMTVVQALSLGGGLSEFGTDSGIRVERRNGSGGVQDLEVSLNDALQPNDVIYVRESVF